MHMHKGLCYVQINLQQDVSGRDRESFRIKDTRLAEILIETLTSRYNKTKAEKYQSIYWWRLIEFFSLGIYIFCKNVDVFTGQNLTYKALLEDTCNLAEALRKYGCDSNTVISVCSENSLNFFKPVIAVLYLGATVAPISHLYAEDELRHAITLYRPKIVFCSLQKVEAFITLKMKLGVIEKLISIDDNQMPNIENIDGFVNKYLGERLLNPASFKPFTDADPCQNVSFILSSSGTTGFPKGVMLTDRNLLVRVAHSRDPKITATSINGNSMLGIMPFFHSFGLNLTLNGIVNRERILVFKKFDEDLFLKTIHDYRIDSIATPPVLAAFLAKSPKVPKYDLSRLQEVICGAAPMSKELENALMKRLNITSMRQGYGLTEANLIVTLVKRNDLPKRGSSGQVVPYMRLKVRDPDTGKSLGPNQTGEICIKAPMVLKGYSNNPQATRDSFTDDGWLKSGDMGYYDADKYFFIVDRLKELIKYKGFQVPPAELESILLNHPKVLDVGVVGVEDDMAGELPLAFVVKKPGIEVTEKELVDYVAKKVSPQKRLRGGVIFLNSIPKNPSGNILRRELRKMIPQSKINLESKL